MERLVKDLNASATISQHFLDIEVAKVRSSISSFNNLVPRFRSTLRVSKLHIMSHLVRLINVSTGGY